MDNDVETETEKKGGTIVEYVRKVFTIARDQYGRNPNHDAFFEPMLDPTSALNWFKGMTRQIFVKSWQDATDRGEPSSKQADPIGLQELREIFRALSTEGSRESFNRLAVLNLNAIAVGRASEIASLSLDVLRWEHARKEGCGFLSARWSQPKIHIDKLVIMCAGAVPELCPFYSLGLAYAAGCFSNQTWREDYMNFLFPELSATTVAAQTTITTWLRQLGSGKGNYAGCPVSSLTSTSTAGGQRVGGINALAMGGVAAELAIQNSGEPCIQGVN